jgi:NAD(P)-dependent dehydrogenase (short-subunit alcohol dehydrogenase family)
MDFNGKIALVTGSTTGIGEACARALAEAGAAVMLSGRNEQRASNVLKSLQGSGAKAEFMKIDVREDGACEKLVAHTIKMLGGLHVLVNNAGILYTANAVSTTNEQWLDTMAINVNALFYMSRAAVKHMKANGGGAIVNIASEWGLNGEPNHVAYCASKGAVVQITRCMALDHAQDNIRVNAVCPGEIHTQMVDDILASKGGDLKENLRELASGIPMRRLAAPAEVARCVRFLASEEASYVTGANLTVDGGNDATAGPYP